MNNTSKTEPGLRQLSGTEVDAVAGAGFFGDVVKVVQAAYRLVTMKGPQV